MRASGALSAWASLNWSARALLLRHERLDRGRVGPHAELLPRALELLLVEVLLVLRGQLRTMAGRTWSNGRVDSDLMDSTLITCQPLSVLNGPPIPFSPTRTPTRPVPAGRRSRGTRLARDGAEHAAVRVAVLVGRETLHQPVPVLVLLARPLLDALASPRSWSRCGAPSPSPACGSRPDAPRSRPWLRNRWGGVLGHHLGDVGAHQEVAPLLLELLADLRAIRDPGS